MTAPREVLTRAEVATLLRCSPPQVVKLVRTKGLPGFQLGAREWRFRRADVEAWLAKRAERKVG